MSLLAAVGLSQSFGGVTALEDVSVEAGPGELVGILGPNGSGKTTLVDALTGMLRPERGRIELGGVDVTARGAAGLARLGVARTFQTTRLMEPLTVGDNVLLGLHCAAVRRRRSRLQLVDAMLDALGIADLDGRVVRELSHGQRRRVELARALVGSPRALVLDEPTAGLFGPDAQAVAQLLAGVAESGVAMFMIEHDLGVVAEVCTRVVVLDRGLVVDQGPTRAVLAGDAVAAISGELGRDRFEAVSA
ncbi:MAG: ATP-binding cassette domain-containing protein [Candidatus Dormibacteraeota bacterium]|uniref:ATP-binding cassette domain-containing protein n=1 Tax=Candidatus Amunia macphersoniae TaxID=3127014 RepID=A0A934KGG7_9BACT|nr:ATP-binding cassette domain-containing protein [Candidatus Dormibacteraeota bacterium]